MKKVKLSDLCIESEIGKYGIPASAEAYDKNKVRYLRISDIDDLGNLINTDRKSISSDEIEKYILKEGEIVFARTGNSTGRTYFHEDKNGILAFAGFLIKFGLDKRKVNPKYLKYYTISDEYKSWVNNLSVGSTRGNINAQTFAGCPILLPERKQQDFLVKILSDIDDKIEVLHQINDNLSELAKTIYDYWFVQFDFPDEKGKPYKTSGGKMVYNEVLKREIPEGWEVKSLGEILTIASGFPFDSNDYNEYGNYQIITIKNVQENYLSLSKADRISFIPSKMKSFCFLEIGDILISLTGNVGRLCFVNKQNLLLNQRVGKFLCDEKYKNYIYCLFNSNETKVRLEKIATGSSQKNLSPIDAVDSFSFIPKENILKKFNKKTNPIYKKNIENLQQIEHLQSLRDWLLPMLMNGQISVE